MAGFGASNVAVRARSRRAVALVAGLLAPLGLGILAQAVRSEELGAFVAVMFAAEAIAFFLLPALAPNGIAFIDGQRRGALHADREGITFRERLLLARSQIRNVSVQGTTDGTQLVRVSAVRKRDDLTIELADEAKARGFLSALELDPDRHVATFSVEEDPLRSRARWLGARALIAAGGLALLSGVLALAQRSELLLLAIVPVLLVYALFLPRLRVRTDVVLGADGLTLHHRGQTRSVPLSAITAVRREKCQATIVRNDGEELTLRFGRHDDEEAEAQHDSFASRMRQALVRRDLGRDPSEELLARGERRLEEWAAHLRSLVQPEGGYRVAAPMPDETLWRVAEGTAAEPTARVGALVALHSRLDDGARERLRSLAECTAQRELRAALEAAAEGRDADEILDAYERTASK